MNVSYRIIRPDGRVRWINDRADVLFDQKGKPVSAVGVLRDVTAIRELELSVSRGWARQHILTDLLGALHCGLDSSGRILNRQIWAKLTGQKISDAAGWGWLDMLPEDRRTDAKRTWIEALTNQSSFLFETDIRCHDGQSRPYRMRFAPLKERDGLASEWIGIITPIDESEYSQNPIQTKLELLTGIQVRAARGALGWSREDLARVARVSISSVRRLEYEESVSPRSKTVGAIWEAFNRQGVFFSKDTVMLPRGSGICRP